MLERAYSEGMSDHPGAPPPPPPDPSWGPLDPHPTQPTGQFEPYEPVASYGATGEYATYVHDDEYGEEPGWSSSAKAIVAILSVLALIGIAGTVWGFMRAGDSGDSADSTGDEITLLTERATTAETELVELQTSTRAQIDALTAERDQLQADLAAAGERIEELTAELDAVQTELDDLKALIEDLDNPFPVIIDPDLTAAPISGNYAALLTQVSCAGFSFCNNPPSLNQATISQPGGGVELNIPGFMRVSFDRVGGQLFGSTNDQSFIGPCAGTVRDVQILMNMYADDGSVAADGSLTLSGLAASVIVDAGEVAGAPECPRSRVWYQLQLDRVG